MRVVLPPSAAILLELTRSVQTHLIENSHFFAWKFFVFNYFTSFITMSRSGSEPETSSHRQQRTKRGQRVLASTDISDLSEFKEVVREMMSTLTSKQDLELGKITKTLKEIKESNRKIEDSIDFLTEKYDDFQKRIDRLEDTINEDKKYITILEDKIEDLQRGTRKTSFELKNVPKRKGETKEDLLNMVICLSNNILCSVSRSDIRDIYRVRGKNDKQNTPIVVETNSTMLKIDVLKMTKAFNLKHKYKLCAKHLGLKTLEDTPVFISEHLTAKGSRLHFLARDLVRLKTYKFCWTAYGNIYLRKDETTPIITVKSEHQLHKLLIDK